MIFGLVYSGCVFMTANVSLNIPDMKVFCVETLSSDLKMISVFTVKNYISFKYL